MLNKDIPKDILKRVKLLVLDTDGVTIKRGTEIKEEETEEYWSAKIKTKKISPELAKMIERLMKKGIMVMVSSGRSMVYLQSMYSKLLGTGAVLQAENGNLSLVEGKIIQHFQYSKKYFKKISRIRERIKELPIHGFEPKQFILTAHSPREIEEVYGIVKEEDPEGELKVMWNGEAFDIQKKKVSKGEGLRRLIDYLNIDGKTVAIGDRVNDKELLDVSDIAVSADKNKLKEEYWTTGKGLPGGQLVKYLLERI